TKCCARSAMYSVFRSDRPQARSWGRLRLRTFCGVISPTHSQTLFQTLCAALTEICCPQIARARVMNASPRRIMNTLGWARMMRAMVGSVFIKDLLALSQYSGFMERQIEEEILRLHAHDIAVVAGQREVDRAPGNIATRHRAVGELEPEQREDAAHPALVDLPARPELVQARGRLGVQADVPRPALFLDLADLLGGGVHRHEMKNPGLDDLAQGIERRPPVGGADHGIVLRLAVPVDRGVGAVDDVQL